MNLALNNLQSLMCHKTKPNQTKPNTIVKIDKNKGDLRRLAIAHTPLINELKSV